MRCSGTTGPSRAPIHWAAAGQWHHVEIAARYTDGGGFIKLWIDRNLVIDIAGDTNTGVVAPTSVTGFRLLWSNGTGNATFDGVLLWDEAGWLGR